MNTDRDPVNPAAVGYAVVACADVWNRTNDPERCEAAAKLLLDVLLAQGCLTPEEYGGAYLEEPPVPGYLLANVRVEGLGWLQANDKGEVAVVSED